MSENIIEFENFGASFGSKPILRDINLAIPKGCKMAIVGESGSGKTQLSQAMVRLNPALKPTGSIKFMGKDVLAMSERELRGIRGKRISYIFQEPMSALNPVMKVGKQIIEPLVAHLGLPQKEAREKAIELLKMVGLENPEKKADGYPFELSGGQRQRVMVAMAVAAEPELLVADEPTTALDQALQEQIIGLLDELTKKGGMTLLYITHDLRLVNNFCERVAVLKEGDLVEKGAVAEVFGNPQHDYTRMLLDARLTGSFVGVEYSAMDGQAGKEASHETDSTKEDSVKEEFSEADSSNADNANSDIAQEHSGKAEAEESFDNPNESHDSNGGGSKVVLKADNVSVTYKRKKGFFLSEEVPIIKDVNLDLRAGRTLGILGESGSGKSTLALALMKLVEYGGKVSVNGKEWKDLKGVDLMKKRKEIQIVFQDPFGALNPKMTLHALMKEGLELHYPELDEKETMRRIVETLEDVGLDAGMINRYAHEFSGGQRQRIAIARVLVIKPDVLVLDEPTSALDVSLQKQLLLLLAEVQKKYELAMVIISHDVSVIRAMSHDIMVLRSGRVIEAGSSQEVICRPVDEYTRTLVRLGLD